MTQSDTPTPSRLGLARRRRGLTKITLAAQAGITTRSVYDFETGRAEPSPHTLEIIADTLRFPVTFFYRSDLEEPTPDVASFRSLKSMTAGQRDSALAAGALAFELSQWIDDRFELPQAELPDLRDFEAEAAAVALRSQWGIGERPIGNLVHLLEAHGVRVFSLAEQGNRLDAFSLWYRNTPFIFLNTNKTADHSRMDAAHELGHLVLHRHGGPHGRDLEKEAQSFGAAFLMPRGSVLSIVQRLAGPSLNQLIQLKQNWRVSVAALTHRLHVLGVLTDWNYRRLCIEIAQYGRTREPNGITRETSQVLSKIFAALREDGISKADVARQLGLYTPDLDALIFGLSLAAATEGRSVPDSGADQRRRKFRRV